MKKQDWQKLSAKTTAELQQQLEQWQRDILKQRHEKTVGRLVNPGGVSRLADDIARVKTLLSQRARAEEGEATVSAAA